ncbi:signal transduction histidine kinase [Streptomyces aurantiacus]|uniref:sensor histidine kinase n=1 Tax=Streptomyces aurantiacus TaxID=47760 RepID=UPI0027949207|nr:HAMP domain-containing sensor histidine kinase [Streptomyces aurantiacus]MDQ0778965.1 signal transduction histidine kinase [Streptomyces aurantiacus]
MRRRLLLTYLALIGGVLIALALPLGLAYAQERTAELLLARRADATRLADLAEQAIQESDVTILRAEITRYASLYGATVEIRRGTGTVLVESGGGVAGGAKQFRRALAGRTTEHLPLVTLFGPGRVVIAEPVGSDAQVTGVLLLAAPTSEARNDVALIWLALAGGAAAAFALAVEAARRLARWTLRPVAELDAATEAIAQGRMTARVAGTGSGPSELRRLEDRFNAMADAVASALAKQRAFISDASHELRTPLSVLSLRLENLRAHLAVSGTERYDQVMQEMDRIGALLEDLLTLGRIEAEGPAQARPADLVAELERRLRVWQEVADASGLTLRTELPRALTTPCPADTLGRITDVAVDNAIKFVPRGGRITVILQGGITPHGGLLLRVEDDGPGLDAQEITAARNRFWRSARHSGVDGSGLGLAIGDELARAAGGTLELRARQPQGLVVEFRLPDVGP